MSTHGSVIREQESCSSPCIPFLELRCNNCQRTDIAGTYKLELLHRPLRENWAWSSAENAQWSVNTEWCRIKGGPLYKHVSSNDFFVWMEHLDNRWYMFAGYNSMISHLHMAVNPALSFDGSNTVYNSFPDDMALFTHKCPMVSRYSDTKLTLYGSNGDQWTVDGKLSQDGPDHVPPSSSPPAFAYVPGLRPVTTEVAFIPVYAERLHNHVVVLPAARKFRQLTYGMSRAQGYGKMVEIDIKVPVGVSSDNLFVNNPDHLLVFNNIGCSSCEAALLPIPDASYGVEYASDERQLSEQECQQTCAATPACLASSWMDNACRFGISRKNGDTLHTGDACPTYLASHNGDITYQECRGYFDFVKFDDDQRPIYKNRYSAYHILYYNGGWGCTKVTQTYTPVSYDTWLWSNSPFVFIREDTWYVWDSNSQTWISDQQYSLECTQTMATNSSRLDAISWKTYTFEHPESDFRMPPVAETLPGATLTADRIQYLGTFELPSYRSITALSTNSPTTGSYPETAVFSYDRSWHGTSGFDCDDPLDPISTATGAPLYGARRNYHYDEPTVTFDTDCDYYTFTTGAGTFQSRTSFRNRNRVWAYAPLIELAHSRTSHNAWFMCANACHKRMYTLAYMAVDGADCVCGFREALSRRPTLDTTGYKAMGFLP